MRRNLRSVLVGLVAGVVGAALGPAASSVVATTAAVGAPAPAGDRAVVAPPPGIPVCTATDHRLIGLSGLIVTRDGFIAISDSNIDKSAIRIWYLDRHCHYLRSIGYPTAAYDPEDVAIGRDGTLYVADTGDNDQTRRSIAVWRLTAGSKTPKIFRYAYPDGAHDAEAILLATDDTPIFVTKDPFDAGVYVPIKPADPSGKPVPLKRVGAFGLSFTSTPNGLGPLGSVVIDGGAQTADRRKVALRSYADAYEWAVPDGNVVKAITTAKPTITPLPGEPFGESIAYGAAGTDFYTVSDIETQPVRTTILRYPSTISTPTSPKASGQPGQPASDPAPHAPRAAPASTDSRTGHRATFALVSAGLAVALVAACVTGAARARRRRDRYPQT